ncbi:hypothetical protein B0T25DRAFT_548729 [Lasiosphaeria hispida]|uniref:F-box domain-containing protein n=1 Tax=Lasiosphaeria hispida TaxID=260671 RepID=A0AAJ0HF84_9PEZI|nr:hypothetical protein B0T25DRAFT_548729 [Lasiosphaeria hispida]
MARHLCTLPEELLLQIMRYLDPTSIQCLRRTSRIFLRLFSSPCFSHQHNKELSIRLFSCLPYTPWARPSRAFEAEAHTRRFIEYLERDARRNLCVSCRAVESDLKGFHRARNLIEKRLYCAACGVEHPLVYFSAAERQKDEQARVCIGYEGHFRLCEHKVINWKTVTDATRKLMSYPANDHAFIPLLECTAAMHIPTNHTITAQKWPGGKIFPRLYLHRYKDRNFSLRVEWAAHLPLSEPASSGRHLVDDLTDRLKLLRRGTAEYFAPQSRPGYLPEMRLFDPNRCDFLDYTGTPSGTGIGGDWSLAPPSDSNTQSCRTHTGPGCSLRRPKDPRSRTTDEDGYAVGSHIMRTLFGMGRRLPYHLGVKARACSEGDRCLVLSYVRDIFVADISDAGCRKVTHSWCEALDPDSYKLAEDSENEGTLWCRNETCANYYRFLERPVMRRCRGKVGDTMDWFCYYNPDTWPTIKVRPPERNMKVVGTAQGKPKAQGNPSTGGILQPKTRRKRGKRWARFWAKCCGRQSSR